MYTPTRVVAINSNVANGTFEDRYLVPAGKKFVLRALAETDTQGTGGTTSFAVSANGIGYFSRFIPTGSTFAWQGYAVFNPGDIIRRQAASSGSLWEMISGELGTTEPNTPDPTQLYLGAPANGDVGVALYTHSSPRTLVLKNFIIYNSNTTECIYRIRINNAPLQGWGGELIAPNDTKSFDFNTPMVNGDQLVFNHNGAAASSVGVLASGVLL